MTEEILQYNVADGVATLVMNRPEKRNALNGALIGAIIEGLIRAGQDREVSVIVLTGAGADFCAGADLEELERITSLGPEESLEDALDLGDLFVRMRRHPKPIVAAVRGRALAGGCGLATACDLIVAEEGAEFGYPEVHLGFVPAMVMAILRRKVGESQAFGLVAGGERISAARAAAMGLVDRVFPTATFNEEAESYANRLAEKPGSAIELSKRLLYDLDGLSFEEGIKRGADVNVMARMTEACREGVRRFLSRGKD